MDKEKIPEKIKKIDSWTSFWQFLDSKQGQYLFDLLKKSLGVSWINNLIKSITDIVLGAGLLWFVYFLTKENFIDDCTFSALLGTVIGYILSNRFKKS